MSTLLARLVELEADVCYTDDPADGEPEFGYTRGRVPVLLSAPHGAAHRRRGHEKWEDEFTAGLARLVAERTGAYALWLRRRSEEELNYRLGTRYKRHLRRIVNGVPICFVMDLHGAMPERDFGIALGTTNGESCPPPLQARIVAALDAFGFRREAEGVRRLVMNPRGYRATGRGTITRYVSERLLVPAIQFELNAHLRIPERRAGASDATPFRSCDPALIADTVAALCAVVDVVAGG